VERGVGNFIRSSVFLFARNISFLLKSLRDFCGHSYLEIRLLFRVCTFIKE
jgi:hypothetical protein